MPTAIQPGDMPLASMAFVAIKPVDRGRKPKPGPTISEFDSCGRVGGGREGGGGGRDGGGGGGRRRGGGGGGAVGGAGGSGRDAAERSRLGFNQMQRRTVDNASPNLYPRPAAQWNLPLDCLG